MMNTTTLTAASAAVNAAVDNLTAASNKASQAGHDSAMATAKAASLDQRLKAGDATVDIAEMIESKASAERLSTLVTAFTDALPGFEDVIREARTAETVAKLQANVIRDREQLAAFVEAMAAKLADELEALVPSLEDERVAVATISNGLPDTTAHNGGLYSRHQYRNGEPSSPIQIANDGDSYTVNGNVYPMALDPDAILRRIINELSTITLARKAARDLPAIMAARAARAAVSREQADLDQQHRDVDSLRRS